MEKAEIIVIGDELLIGQVTDTNSSFIERSLNEIGISIRQVTVVHDDSSQIRESLHNAWQKVDLVLMTGGLGPTKDDITKQTLCDFFGTDLVPNEDVKHHIYELYKNRPQVLNRLTDTQWLVPRNAQILENRVGSAPIMWFEEQQADKRKILISMPGVPRETEIAIIEQVIPKLKHFKQEQQIIHRNVRVQGIPESSLAIKIEEWEDALPTNMHLAYLPSEGKITLRLTGMAPLNDNLAEEIEKQLEELKKLIKEYLIN